MHNPRAEAAKEDGCSMDEFFRLMREDDALDADLTDLGREQAMECHEQHFKCPHGTNRRNIDLIVASCLSRTIDTADLVFPDTTTKRISVDDFREVNGNLLNGKRRTKSELLAKYPHWNFDSLLGEHDESWTPEMEDFGATAERGYRGLVALLTGNETERNILLVCHGGILRYTMNIHPLVHLEDQRTTSTTNPKDQKAIDSRFDNCELRKYRLSWKKDEHDENDKQRRAIVLTQLDH